MGYKLTMNGLQVDRVMDGNPCEWTLFIMCSCPILASTA
jgi:hypothetical protein